MATIKKSLLGKNSTKSTKTASAASSKPATASKIVTARALRTGKSGIQVGRSNMITAIRVY